MDIRTEHERLDERLDESPRLVTVEGHDNDDTQSAAPPDQLVFEQPAQPPAPSASGPPAPPMSLLGSDPADVQDRWHDLQACFVDDPRDAVQRADSLLDEVMASIHQALESRIRELQDLWKNTDQSDTEQLRLALRSYRDCMHRLLSLADEQPSR